MNIITDIDDVILNTQASIASFLNAKKLKYSEVVKFKNGFIDLSSDWMKEYLESDFYSEIPILFHADEVLARCKSKGFNLFALTSPPKVGYANRELQLNRDFPNMFIETIIKSGSKGDMISDIISRHNLCVENTYFIDDAPHNIESAMAIPNLNVVWMKNEQNKDFLPKSTRVSIVHNILEFESLLLDKI